MTEKPVRIQLSRKKGWRMPPNTVKVDRSTRWGNPFTAEQFWDAGYKGSPEVAVRNCVAAYKAWMLGERHWAHGAFMADAPDPAALRGKNLACWCALSAPCHADVLLDLANRISDGSPTGQDRNGLGGEATTARPSEGGGCPPPSHFQNLPLQEDPV